MKSNHEDTKGTKKLRIALRAKITSSCLCAFVVKTFGAMIYSRAV
jgi:hypothetical protein